jgi:hypothetical protein
VPEDGAPVGLLVSCHQLEHVRCGSIRRNELHHAAARLESFPCLNESLAKGSLLGAVSQIRWEKWAGRWYICASECTIDDMDVLHGGSFGIQAC